MTNLLQCRTSGFGSIYVAHTQQFNTLVDVKLRCLGGSWCSKLWLWYTTECGTTSSTIVRTTILTMPSNSAQSEGLSHPSRAP